MKEGLVHDDHAVLRGGGDVAQVIRVQAGVERVDHRPHQGHREVQLEMLCLVEQQGRHSVAVTDSQAGQSPGELSGAPGAFAHRRAID